MSDCQILVDGCARLVGDFIWISLLEFNCLAKVDIRTGRLSYEGRLPIAIGEWDYQLHSQINVYGDKLIFSPWNSDYIAIRDMDAGRFRQIRISDGKTWRNTHGTERFFPPIQDGKTLFYISENGDEIRSFDMEQEQITGVYDFPRDGEMQRPFGSVPPVRVGDAVWKILETPGASCKFDLLAERCEGVELFARERRIYTGCGCGRFIWLLTENAMLCQFTAEGRLAEEYDLSEFIACKPVAQAEKKEAALSIHLNGVFYLIWLEEKKVVAIPMKGDRADVAACDVFSYVEAGFEFCLADQLIMIERGKITLFWVGERKEILLDGEREFVGAVINANKKMWENRCIGLAEWAECIPQGKNASAECCGASAGDLGRAIHQRIKSE